MKVNTRSKDYSKKKAGRMEAQAIIAAWLGIKLHLLVAGFAGGLT
jgi:hypothetical protein